MGVIARQSFKASIVGFLGVGVGAINVLFILPKFLTPEEIGVVSTIQRASILLYSLMILGVVSPYGNSIKRPSAENPMDIHNFRG